jgi:DNA helicase HerA-like ATPase
VVLGMTGSGKTGLLMVTVEEALRSQVPVIMIDVKGDLPNLLLAFSSFEASVFAPLTDGQGSPDEAPVANLAEQPRASAGGSSAPGVSARPISSSSERAPACAC